MKIRSERDKRTYLIIALCAILVVMGVGYAAFSSMLTINGTANISNSWCVGFDNTMTSTMEVTKGVSTGTTPTGTMSYSGTACGSTLQPNSSLNAHFYQPGDEIEYTLTITNKSTVTAAIKSILVDNESVTSNTTKKKGNITYVVEMPAKTTLAVNESTTMKVIAKFQNETDVTGNVNGETKTIEVKINAEQDDGNGGFTPTPSTFTGSIYRWSTTRLANKNSYAASNSNYPYTIENLNKDIDYIEENDYPTFSSRTTKFGKQYYLKHDIVNDEIINSYVCFVYNNGEHCIKGAVFEVDLDDKPTFDANTQIIRDYNTYYSSQVQHCGYESGASYCYGGGFSVVDTYSSGGAAVRNSSSEYCSITNDGDSYCSE